jgi:dienelactone hydrolase
MLNIQHITRSEFPMRAFPGKTGFICITGAFVAFAGASASLFGQNPLLMKGDWVGELRIAGKTTFVRAGFAEDSAGALVTLDMPTTETWGVEARLDVTGENSFAFSFPLADDTAYVEGRSSANTIDGRVRASSREGTLHLIHRMEYDSTFVRSVMGNYAIAPDRIISVGPMDEAGGWLSFFDSKTLRGGILYALADSTFYTGPSYGVDYPVAIRAVIHRDGRSGQIDGIVWSDSVSSHRAQRLDDFKQAIDVSFMNGDVRLVGDLTLPNTPGPHPAVILVHGCCGSKPTRDFGYWSAYLAHHGIAVLAFDRRGGGASGGDFNSATYDDLAGDVLAGVDMLTHRADIDAKHIGLFGMSNGGYVSPLAAARSNGRIAFVVVRSGSARRVGDNIDYEVGNDLLSHGFDSTAVQRGVKLRRRVTDFVIDRPALTAASWDSIRAEVRAVREEPWFQWSRVIWVLYVSPAESGGALFINSLRQSWAYDPVPSWKQLKVPVYIMLGGLDRSVPTAESAPVFRKVFQESGNPDATVRVYARANHGLLLSSTGFGDESRYLQKYVPDFQASVVAWIRKHVGLPP